MVVEDLLLKDLLLEDLAHLLQGLKDDRTHRSDT
jgi:hypothetical protein